LTRRTFGAFALLLLSLTASTSSSAQEVVGHVPSQSPFQDLSGRHLTSLQLGWIMPSRDPAGVGPQSGLMLIGRYEYDVTGPVLVSVRSGLAPGLVRNVKDPLFTGPLRDRGERTEPFFFLDGGLVLSLTGEKAWRGLNPRLHTNIGLVTSLNSEYDLGGYRFGPKFIWSWGGSVRGVRPGRFEWNADLTYALWRMQYPSSYKGDGSATDESILGDQRLNPCNGNLILSVGITRAFRR
jgi:hypothetical protein